MKTRKKTAGRKKHILLVILVLLLLISGFLATLKIKNVTYEGNVRLSDEELTKNIFGDSFQLNPLVFFVKSMVEEKVQIPFVEDYDIEMESLTSVKITVYEKSIVGYISYMSTYMYFDKDGIVVENSSLEYDDIPEITGVQFDNIILYEKIPVDNESIFDLILNITQLVDKYDIAVKKINISKDMEVTLYIGSFKVALGSGGSYGEKIAALSDILPKMEDIPGQLDMREYDAGGSYVFKKE